MNIRYQKGDATDPQGPGPKVIVHICNDAGKWGKGFVLAVSKRWTQPEQVYRHAFAKSPLRLGDVQFVPVTDEITVANVIGQHGVRSTRSKAPAPISYPAIREGLTKVARFASEHQAEVSMPRIGCGLAGGTWEEIEPIIRQTLCEHGVRVTVYDYEQ